jgi:NADPH2:quinone reductase
VKFVQAESLDSIADYRLVEAERPHPGPGEVVVKVAACGVGYVDALFAVGRYQIKPPTPYTPGRQVGGWIDEVGEGVTAFRTGDRVMTAAGSGFTEYVCVPAAAVIAVPGRLSLAQAAVFRTDYATALYGLRERGALAAGETLVVFGAAGGVGSAAVQVGKLLGARVVAVASTEAKRAFALGLGADAVVDTTLEGWRERLKAACGGRGPDVVYDPVCGPLFEPAFRSLAWRGRHLVIGFTGGPIPALPANLTLLKGASLIGVDARQFGGYEPEMAAAQLQDLLAWLAEGRLSPPVGRTFPFEEFAAALEFALSGQGLGKTVLQVAPDPAR